MKQLILLLVFLFSTHLIFAQKNSVMLSYLPFQKGFAGKGGFSLSYYRVFPGKAILGIKASVLGFNNEVYQKEYGSNASIDFVNHWILQDTKRFRFTAEAGLSFLRRHTIVYYYDSSVFPSPVFTQLAGNRRVNYYGFSSALGLEYKVYKNLYFGIDYSLKVYSSNQANRNNKLHYIPNLNINLGTQF